MHKETTITEKVTMTGNEKDSLVAALSWVLLTLDQVRGRGHAIVIEDYLKLLTDK